MTPVSIVLLMLGGGLLFSHPKDFPPLEDYYVEEETIEKPGLFITFYGATTIMISDERTSILIDGFFSRPSWRELAFHKISPDTDRIKAMLACCASSVDAIFVSHSHHDHAMDSGSVAAQTGATVLGSPSVGLIAKASTKSLVSFVELKDRAKYIFGEFIITAIETPHSAPPAYPGLIGRDFSYPASASDFRVDLNYSFFIYHPELSLLVVPSGNYRTGDFIGFQSDVSMISIGGISTRDESFFDTYWKETVVDRGAKLAIPIHWDDFTEPISPNLSALPYVADFMPASHAKLKRLAVLHDVKLKYLRALHKVKLSRTFNTAGD